MTKQYIHSSKKNDQNQFLHIIKWTLEKNTKQSTSLMKTKQQPVSIYKNGVPRAIFSVTTHPNQTTDPIRAIDPNPITNSDLNPINNPAPMRIFSNILTADLMHSDWLKYPIRVLVG